MVAASGAAASVALFVACAAVIVAVGVVLARRPGRESGRDGGDPWVPRPLRGRGTLATGAVRVVVLGAIMAGGFLVVLGVGALLGFATRTTALERINQDVLSWFVAHRAGWLNGVMNTLTGIGSAKYVIFPLCLIVGLGFSIWYDNPLPMVLAVATVLGVKALQHYLIDIVQGPFPPHATAIGPTGSYPSGGTARVVAMFGMAAFLFAVRRPHRRRTVIALFTVVSLLVLAEGFSRLYLGRHWLLDVVGGLLVGALWLGILAFGTRALFRFDAPQPRRPSSGRTVPVEVREPADGARV